MNLKITVIRDGATKATLPIAPGTLVIGRNDECDIRLDSRSVSRRHCEIKQKPTGLTIRDLGSRNGTIINGDPSVPGTRVPIKESDVIKVGKYILRIDQASSPLADGGSVDGGVNDDAGEDGSPASADQFDMLADLESFIRDRLESGDLVNFKASPDVAADDNQTTVTWNSNSIDEDGGSAVAEVKVKAQTPVDGAASPESMVSISKNEEIVVDEAEVRRLELRKRLASLKAKDSKEAADRALKRMFGG